MCPQWQPGSLSQPREPMLCSWEGHLVLQHWDACRWSIPLKICEPPNLNSIAQWAELNMSSNSNSDPYHLAIYRPVILPIKWGYHTSCLCIWNVYEGTAREMAQPLIHKRTWSGSFHRCVTTVDMDILAQQLDDNQLATDIILLCWFHRQPSY